MDFLMQCFRLVMLASSSEGQKDRERELSGPRELPNWPDKSWAATTRCALPLAALPQLLRPLLAPADSLNLLTNLAVFALASNRYC